MGVESLMAGALSFISVTSGTIAAYCAQRFPARTETLETITGIALLGGFALLGCSLPSLL